MSGTEPGSAHSGDRSALIDAALAEWRRGLIDLGGRNALLYCKPSRTASIDLALAPPDALARLLSGAKVGVLSLLGVQPARRRPTAPAADGGQSVPGDPFAAPPAPVVAAGLARLDDGTTTVAQTTDTPAGSATPAEDPYPAARADMLKRARNLHRRTREGLEERGINTLYLAMGFVTWANPKSTSVPNAPLLLRSATIRPRGAVRDEFDVTLDGDVEVNPTLLHAFRTEFGCAIDPLAILGGTGPDGMDGLVDIEGAVRRMQELAAAVPGITVRSGLMLGTFSYAKLPMVEDLDRARGLISASDVVAALAGDPSARVSLAGQSSRSGVRADAPNHIPPADEFLVLDADSSQNYAVNAALAGCDLIVMGPPGTGKSQTIANIIAAAVARGKRVLFVAEKRAAIDAVARRLSDPAVDLEPVVLDLHGGLRRRELAQRLARTYDKAGAVPAPPEDNVLERLELRRDALVRHEESVHKKRDPWGLSVFEIRARLLELPGEAVGPVRLSGETLKRIDAVTFRTARRMIEQLADLGAFGRYRGWHPWAGSGITSDDEAYEAWEAAGRLAMSSLPQAAAAFSSAAQATGLAVGGSLESWEAALSIWDAVATVLDAFHPSVFTLPFAELHAALDRGAPTGIGAMIDRRLDPAYRSARDAVQAHLRDRSTGDAELVAAFRSAEAVAAAWRERAGPTSVPTLPADLSGLADALRRVLADARDNRCLARALDASGLGVDEIAARASRLHAEPDLARMVPEIERQTAAVAALGLEEVLADLIAAGLDGSGSAARFEHAWLSSILRRLEFLDENVGRFSVEAHAAAVEDFKALDIEHIWTTPRRIRRLHAERVIAAASAHPQQAGLVRAEGNRKKGHLPLRELVRRAPDLIFALKPCWAMSPLVVSQVLPADQVLFDLVIFDEASQITPADAIPSIARGRKVVVAGDDRQLPPTSFFLGSNDDDGEAETGASRYADVAPADPSVGGFESILDILRSVLDQRMLTWHYRSRDERLIAFSNVNFYDRSLVTFPGTITDAIRHVQAPFRAMAPEEEGSPPDEVSTVVDLILEHAATRPRRSLGVIAMGIPHANRIDDALRERLRGRADLEAFFSEDSHEPFFVKNLERVQGDERDSIILTIGYGRHADGRMFYNFGPVNQAGGERRLNVAVTRAREAMTLVSSFTSSDMDPARIQGRGVELLREYLRFAESGGAALGDRRSMPPPLNPFERQVRDALVEAGLSVTAQHGVSGYRIDFAVAHPRRPNVYLLAVECDGASYHSQPTARDRDRLRQEHLERLGWRFHRIWSTDWFRDRTAALGRVLEAYETALADHEAGRPGPRRPRRAAPARAEQPPVWTSPLRPPPPAMGGQPPQSRPTARPPLAVGLPITEYRAESLQQLVDWIESDTLLRTEDELLRELMRDLGFQRSGPRIDQALRAAIRAARARRPGRGG